MNCGCSCLSPFRWQCENRPSQFLTDPHFYRGAKSGMTVNAIQTQAVSRYEARTGRSAGSIKGISPYGDLLIEESTHQRKGSYKRRAG